MTSVPAPILGHEVMCVCPCCAANTLADEASAMGTGTSAAASKPIYNNAQVSEQLTKNWSTSGDGWAWDQNNITYTLSYAAAGRSGPEQSGWQAMTNVMKNAAREAMELWDDVVAISITETPNNANANISLNYSSTTGNSTYASPRGFYNGDRAEIRMTDADIWFATGWSTHNDNSDFYGGGYGILTYVHEIGHALGLSHPGQYNGSASFASDADYYQDTRQYTTMSYFRAGQNGETVDHIGSNGYSTAYAASPLLHDILALQSIYGADTTTRTGATTYGFNSNAGRDAFDFTQNLNPVVAIWDAGGVDTIDVSGWNTNQTVNLTAGSFSSIGSMTKNLAVAYGAVIENAVGGGGNDMLLGNGAANRLTGGNGTDTLKGGNGRDTLIGGRGIDNLEGGAGNDVFYFGASDQGATITDFGGGDSLSFANAGLAASVFSSAVQSGANTFLIINGTRITLNGTDKNDLAVSGTNIVISTNPTPPPPPPPSNGIINGTAAADTLMGTSADEIINGNAGTDTLYGRGGNDVLDAGAGTGAFQYLSGGTGNDTYQFAKSAGRVFINSGAESAGTGSADQIVFRDLNVSDLTFAELDYSRFSYGGNDVALRMLWNDGGGAGELRVANEANYIESFVFADGTSVNNAKVASATGGTVNGGNQQDLLVGQGGTDRLNGGNGNDILDARGGGGSFQYLAGQNGNDTYHYSKDSRKVYIRDDAEGNSSGTADRIIFKDLNLSDFTFDTLDYSRFSYEGNQTALRMMWSDGGSSGELRIAHEGRYIESFEFADGTVMTYDDFLV